MTFPLQTLNSTGVWWESWAMSPVHSRG